MVAVPRTVQTHLGWMHVQTGCGVQVQTGVHTEMYLYALAGAFLSLMSWFVPMWVRMPTTRLQPLKFTGPLRDTGWRVGTI